MHPKMAAREVASLLILFLLLPSSATAVFDIIEILEPFEDYTNFTALLRETKVAEEVNAQKNVTVLVVADTDIAPLLELTGEALRNAVALHALPDYYDPYYFEKLPSKTATIPTLLQAGGDLGMLHFSELPEELMVFGSAVPGSPQDAEVNRVVVAKPRGNNLAVLEISKPILPQGIGGPAVGATAPADATSTTSMDASDAMSPETSTLPDDNSMAVAEPPPMMNFQGLKTLPAAEAPTEPTMAEAEAPPAVPATKPKAAAISAGRTAAGGRGVALGIAATTVALLTL